MLSPRKRMASADGVSRSAARTDDAQLDRRSVELLARFAHEARQPLSAARAAFDLIRHSPDAAQRERACIVIDRQLVRLARLLDDLLETSRLRLENMLLRAERIDLRGLVEEAVEAVRPNALEKDQQLVARLPDQPVWMDGDPGRLQQVLSNLLVNGIKYTGRNGCVSVDLTVGPQAAVLTVSDTGRGMSADILLCIFEPFTRGDDAQGAGLGVGLAIARQWVEVHGGTICASSAGPGRGSEFVVTLPTASPFRPGGTEHEQLMTTALLRISQPKR
jgi:signal transduction histidine kinase